MTRTHPRAGAPSTDGDPAADGGLAAVMAADARLADELVPAAAPQPGVRTTTVVTGATGFFGAALVDALLRAGEGDVLCLVRAPGDEAARARLTGALARAGYRAGTDRLRAIAADIAEPGLGLTEDRRREIRAGAARVVHAAANVNGSLPYASLRASTVFGTAAVLRLAAEAGATLHHVSTTAAVPVPGAAAPAGAVPLPGLGNGYAQSKWVAERLVDAARQRGLRAWTYRLGALAGHRGTASSNERDFRWIFVRACLELRAAPHIPGDLCWVPVDVAADAVAALARDDLRAADRHTLQIAASTGVRWAEVFSWLRRAGHRLDVVEPALWWDLLRDRLAGTPDLARMAAFAPSLPSGAPRPDDGTWAALAPYGVTEQPFDRHLLLRYVATPATDGQEQDGEEGP
nr:hypothetical protein GCM10020063_007710 [Dactylosporangium thailandense]